MKKSQTYLTLLDNLSLVAQTNISWGIFSNKTFTLKDSFYFVTGDVFLFSDVESVIEPGVEIKFDSVKYRKFENNVNGIIRFASSYLKK